MKKITLVFGLILSIFANVLAGGNATAVHDHPLDNGFALKFHVGLPSAKYSMSDDGAKGLEDAGEELKNYRPGAVFGLEIGNQWTFYRSSSETFGIGLMVNWFGFDFGSKKYTQTVDFGDAGTAEYEVVNAALEIEFLEFGPMATIALNDEMGVDFHYQFSPSWFSSASSYDGGETTAFTGVGINSALGAGFRYNILYAGLEYNFGKIKVSNSDFSDFNPKVNTNALRVIIGMKF